MDKGHPPEHRRGPQATRLQPERAVPPSAGVAGSGLSRGGAQGNELAAPGASGPRSRRRRLLGRAFLSALALLLLINVATAVRDRGFSGAVGSSGGFSLRATRLLDALPGGDYVRVYRQGPVRWLANRVRGPVRVGLQVGHQDAALQPDELAALRFSTGAHHAGLDEVIVNRAVVDALAERLRQRGAIVDVLSAAVPPAYRADLVLAVHADSSADPARNGYKSAHFWPERNPGELLLKLTVDRAVLRGTRLSDDDSNVSSNMFEYYAFNHRRFTHAVSRSTPALLVELGYLSNPRDRELLRRPDALAAALEQGVVDYLIATGRVDSAW